MLKVFQRFCFKGPSVKQAKPTMYFPKREAAKGGYTPRGGFGSFGGTERKRPRNAPALASDGLKFNSDALPS